MVGNPNADNDLNISGSNVTVTANGNDSVGITVDGSLNVEGSTVTGNGTSGGISAGSMTVTGGGSVSGTGSAEDSLGISARYSLIVEGGSVTGEGSRYGIQAGEINVSGKEIGNSIVSGSVSGTSAGNNSEGILSTIVTVNSGGSVTGTGTAANSIGVNVYSLEVNGGTLEGSGTDSGVLSRSITVTGGSVIGTGSSTGIWVYDDENAAAMTISGGGSVTATSTTAGRGIYAPGMNISIDDTSTLTASAKFDGSAVICGTISVGENKYTPEEKEKLTVKDGKVTWEEVEREITLYVNGVNIIAAPSNTVNFSNGGTATYDTETKVLTLTDATITSAHDGNGIYTDYNLTIELEGSSTISGNSITNGIKVAGDLTINGSGSLETTGSSAGISATGSLSIDGASTVTASSTGNSAPVSCSSLYVDGAECESVKGASVFKAEEGVVTWITNVSALYVDGVDMLTDVDNTITCGSGTAAYDPSTNTLTLNGATIASAYTTTATTSDGKQISCGIYAEGDLNIILSGTSTVSNEAAPFYEGVYVDGSLTITGDGSLTATGSEAGIYVDGPMKVTGGSVTGTGTAGTGILAYGIKVTGGSISGTGDKTSNGITSRGDMTVSGGGSVRGEGNYAVYVGGNITVSDEGSSVTGIGDGQGVYAEILYVTDGSVNGSTTRTSGSAYGIFVNNGMKVEGGTVDGNSHYVGIQSYGNMEVSGGIVTGDGNLYGIFVPHDLIVTGGSVIGTSAKLGIWVASLQVNGGSVEGTANGSDEDTAEMVYGITAQQGMQIQNGSVTGTASSAGTCYGLSTTGGSVYIDNYSTVKAESSHGRATNFSSFTVGGTEYTLSQDATELKVEDGKVTGAEAKASKSLYVDGVDIMDADGYKVQCDKGGTASYDPDTKTLTLDDVTITTGHTIDGVTFGIYSDGDLNIVLEGTSTVGSNQFDAGVYIDGSLTVTGSGSLEATGSRGGIYVADDLTISSGSVTGNGNGEDSLGISVISNMEVSGGTVTGNGNGEDSCGIYVDDGNMTVNSGGSVTGNGNGEGSCGIRIEELIVNGGRVTGNGTGDYSYGVFANSDAITINGESHYFSASSETPGYAVNGLIYVGGKEYTPKYGATQITVENGTVTQFSPIPEPKPDGALYVNGENILTAENNTVQCGSGKAVYDPDTNTLTLTNATITTADSDGCGIYYESDLNIVLEGTSTVGNHEFNAGIYIEGELTISGTGSLNATGSYEGICVDNLTVNSGTVTGTGDLGIYVAEHMAVNDGTVSGTSTGTGAQISLGIYVYTLTMTGGTVTGEGDTAAIIAILWDEAEYDELISLPEGYLPDGYELKQVIDGSNVYETIVQAGEDFYIDEESGDFVGAAKEVTLKDWQGENPDQPTTPSDPATPIIPAVPTTPGKDASQQAVDKIESAQGGETVSVDLTTGKTELDKEVFEELSGKDATLEVKVPGGVTWTVNGKDIPADADLTDLDLSVAMNTKTIPEEVINSVNSEAGTVQLTVKNDGEFGFTMTLTTPVGAKNAGMWANLYHYDEAAGKMVYQASALVDRNGDAALPVGSSGQYALVLDSKSHALPFTDLAAGAWYEDAVAYVYRHDLMSGYSEDLFGPNNDLSRAQLCQIIYNMEGRPTVAGGSSFSDVADGAWYTDAVTWAASQGIVDGYGGGLFGPDDNITREQLASILYRYAQAKGYDVSIGEDTNILSYTDASDVAEYAISAMQWACGSGVITGISESALAPRGEATRAQAAMMLMRFCEQYVKW